MFTEKEQKWIDDMDKLSRKRPKNLIMYTTDSDLIVCKKGESSRETQDRIRGLFINAGCMLTDMHDDMDNGRA